MRRICIAIVLVVVGFLLALQSANATKYVKWNATSSTHDGSSWSKAYLTIQEALNVAVDNETIKVAQGTYTENVVFKSAVVLQGGYRGNITTGLPDTTCDPSTYVTIINGGSNTSGSKTVTSYAGGSINGFTIMGAEIAIYCSTAFTISGNIINGASYGIYCIDCNPTITANTLNGKDTGAIGIYCVATAWCGGDWDHYGYANTCSPTISQNTISGWTTNAIYLYGQISQCSYTWGYGACSPLINNNTLSGGQETIYCQWSGSAVISDNLISSGVTGIKCYSSSPTISGNTITATSVGTIGIQCIAQANCGGDWDHYAQQWTCEPTISDNTLSRWSQYGIDCSAQHASCAYTSGDSNCKPVISANKIMNSGIHGIRCNRAVPVISCNIIKNSTDCGIYCFNDMSSESMLSLKIDNNLISGQNTGIYSQAVSITIQYNTIQQFSKEGVLCDGGSASVVTGNQIYGGRYGVKCTGTTAIFTNPTICQNIITGQKQAGILCQNSNSQVYSNLLASAGQYGIDCLGGSAQLYNNTIVKNGWYGIYVENAAAGYPKCYNNIVYSNPIGCYVEYSTPELGYNNFWSNDSNYEGISKPASDISVDPKFLAPTVGEYHLLPGSPCIGAGNNTYAGLSFDADGKDRILPIEGTVDIGCFEWEDPTIVAYLIRKTNQLKTIPSNYLVEVENKAIVSAFTDAFYIEDDDRSSGIRVEKTAHGLNENTRANITGNVITNSEGERVLSAASATSLSISDIEAVGMPCRSVGGGSMIDTTTGLGQSGIFEGSGLNNIGLLVRVWGKVTGVDSSETPTWFTIYDGSGRTIKCVSEDGKPVISALWLNKYIIITGESSCEYDSGKLVSKIRLKKNETPVLY